MSLACLKTDLRTGIQGLDYEHRELVGVMEEICNNYERTEVTRSVSDRFGELYAEASAHFALEEMFMRRKQYAGYDVHKADHEKLLDQMRSMMDSYEDGKCTNCNLSLHTCLEGWFAGHARYIDSGLRSL